MVDKLPNLLDYEFTGIDRYLSGVIKKEQVLIPLSCIRHDMSFILMRAFRTNIINHSAERD